MSLWRPEPPQADGFISRISCRDLRRSAAASCPRCRRLRRQRLLEHLTQRRRRPADQLAERRVDPGELSQPCCGEEAEEHAHRLLGDAAGVPEDVAEAVSFLAGSARWVNGQVLYANGGVI